MQVARADTASRPLSHQRLSQVRNRQISSELPRLVGMGRSRQIRLFAFPPSTMTLSSVLTMTGRGPWVMGAQALAIPRFARPHTVVWRTFQPQCRGPVRFSPQLMPARAWDSAS
jgi:hypothetical protein